MKKIWLWCFFGIISLYAVEIVVPVHQVVVDGIAKDIVRDKAHLIIGTDQGKLQVYDYEQKRFVKEIVLPDVTDFMGDTIPARIYSVDFMDGRYLLLSDSGKGGYANLWIHENNATMQLLSHDDKKTLIKARFIDKEHILLGYLSNEAALFDIGQKKELYRVQLSESKFSDFALNEAKSKAVFGCESGVLSLIDTKAGKVLKELKGINLDNTYRVDFKQGIISAAGQDRRGALYVEASGKGDYIKGEFLIYATGLSPSASKVAFSMDEKNNISVYNVQNKEKIALLKGQKSTLNAILFLDEETLFSASDDNTILMWKLK